MITNVYKDNKKEPTVAAYTQAWIDLINCMEKNKQKG